MRQEHAAKQRKHQRWDEERMPGRFAIRRPRNLLALRVEPLFLMLWRALSFICDYSSGGRRYPRFPRAAPCFRAGIQGFFLPFFHRRFFEPPLSRWAFRPRFLLWAL